MRHHLLSPCLVVTLIVSPGVYAQFDNPGKRELAKHPMVLEDPAPPPQRNLDPFKIRAEATELADLAGSVPADVDQISHGKLPKNFAEKLKRIEKLSKLLRSELAP